MVGLRSTSTTIRQRQQFLSNRAETVAKQLLQSESDMSAAGNTTIPIIALILITVFVPLFGDMMFNTRRPEVESLSYSTTGYSEPQIRVKSATPSSIYRSDNSNSAMNVYGYTVPDSLTDEQIKNLNDIDKASGAEQLLDRARNNAN